MPVDGASITVSASSVGRFQWAKASGKDVKYSVVFDRSEGDFSNPLLSVESNAGGSSTYVNIAASDLKTLASAAGIQEGGEGTVCWTVAVSSGDKRLVSDVRRSLKLVYADSSIPVEKWNWGMAADSCTFILTNSFMDKDRGIWWGSRNNIAGGNGNNYWGQAYPWHTVLYSYSRIKDSDPTLAATYKTWFGKWVSKNGNNYNGEKRNGFYCQYTDDMAWIALVFLHAYDIWGDATHLTKAKEIYGYMTESARIIDNAEGWGLIWRYPGDIENGVQKDTRNVCTNTPAMIIACELHRITGQQSYLDDAVKIYNFLTKTGNRVNSAGRVGEPPLTYTQGCWIEGCRLLFHLTGDQKYAIASATCVKFTMTSGRCTNNLGILRDEGKDGDQRNFKGGLMPYMINFILDKQMDATTRQSAFTFMKKQAETLWYPQNGNMNRSEYPYMFANYVFSKPYDEDKDINGVNYHNLGWCGMHNCGAALLEGMARLPRTFD